MLWFDRSKQLWWHAGSTEHYADRLVSGWSRICVCWRPAAEFYSRAQRQLWRHFYTI